MLATHYQSSQILVGFSDPSETPSYKRTHDNNILYYLPSATQKMGQCEPKIGCQYISLRRFARPERTSVTAEHEITHAESPTYCDPAHELRLIAQGMKQPNRRTLLNQTSPTLFHLSPGGPPSFSVAGPARSAMDYVK